MEMIRKQNGIPLVKPVVDDLIQVGEQLGVQGLM
jgi:hypothetical protein